MTDTLDGLIDRYQSRGLLVDTNILLLHFVGSFDRRLIPRFKRTMQFREEDYDLLTGLISRFRRLVTTPHVMSEVNSLSGQIGEPARTKYFAEFARQIAVLDEQYVPSATAAQVEQFVKVGLADSGILHLAGKRYLVLTDDARLFAILGHLGIDAVNFNHIRI